MQHEEGLQPEREIHENCPFSLDPALYFIKDKLSAGLAMKQKIQNFDVERGKCLSSASLLTLKF